jgi:glutaminyl-tRNA synthetase
MYDYAHPLEDAIEKITHSLCTLEFEDHRPIYNWFVDEIGFETRPRQIEFAKLQLTNTIMGKRYMRALVENGEVDGWDDPRMMTISGIRRRGYTPESIRDFCEKIGVSKASSTVDVSLLEFCIREDLKAKAKVVMAVLDPVKVVITNYPEGETEMLEIENNPENEEMGKRLVPFSREIYIDRDDFMEVAPPKFFRLSPGREVRLKGAYFITLNDIIKDADGNVLELHCSYDPETKSGSGFNARKVKGTIHWVSCATAVKAETRLYDYLVLDDETSETGFVKNPNSIILCENSYIEPSIKDAVPSDRFQFIRNGYFCLDSKLASAEKLVFNRIVSLKSSYKPK